MHQLKLVLKEEKEQLIKIMEEILEILDNKSKEVNKDYLYETLPL